MHLVSAHEIRSLFSQRPKNSHKGTWGHVLLIGGSPLKPGAILLSGRAALRTGAGLVTVSLPKEALKKISKDFLELMYEPLQEWEKLKRVMKGMRAIGIGPGMGVSVKTKGILKNVIGEAVKKKLPLVVDADALNILAQDLSLLRKGRSIVLTPHPGEMGRLLGISTTKVQKNRTQVAKNFATKHRVYLVLKGHHTLIATPSGKVFMNPTGNPGMATAGMGDVLTGMIISLVAQGVEFEKAIVSAVYLHGRPGDRVAKRLGERGMIATDVIEEIPLVIKKLGK